MKSDLCDCGFCIPSSPNNKPHNDPNTLNNSTAKANKVNIHYMYAIINS